jgi:thiosulfate/3-mercaptopyruvate sulfurtransferase
VDQIETDELARRLGEVTVVDVRSDVEYTGEAGYPCDPRQGHVPGARNLDVARLAEARTPEEVRELVGEPEGAEVVVYCHSGGRSQRAAQILEAAGYRARNYAGSWHEWSRREDLPAEP